MLPLPLLALTLLSLPCPLTNAQQPQMTLSLNTILPITLTSTSTSPLVLGLPSTSSGSSFSISVALCTNARPFPTFFVNNHSDTSTGQPTALSLNEGIGTWSGSTSSSGTLIVVLGDGATGVSDGVWRFEVAVSTGAPLHRNLSDLPLLGDTTATQALLFSPLFAPIAQVPSTYPNYTLPPANLSAPDPPPPSLRPNSSLILAPTTQLAQNLGANMSLSGCAIRAAASTINGAWTGTNGTDGVNGSTSFVLRNNQGWRSQWVIEGLTSSTNYTAWVVQDGGAVADPVYLVTKSSSFSCPLVHSLPFCPQTAYAVPLPPPPSPLTTYTSQTLPQNISDPLLSSLSNFTTALLTFPCGRDVYSPLQSCEACQAAYRTWACLVSLPRCAELLPSSDPPPALLPDSSRTQQLLSNSTSSQPTELLPCIETCNRVDRACPPLMQWTCPFPFVNANQSYGVGFVDGWDGTQGRGTPGVAQDQRGFVWCNG